MQPTTILIEREADAKVFEVIENVYPDVRWFNGGEKPTKYLPHMAFDPHKDLSDPDFPYVISIIDNELTTDGRGRKRITATDWLAQHGYVWDGDGYRPLQVGDTVVTERFDGHPYFYSEMDKYIGKSGVIEASDINIKVHGWWWPRSACKYVAPVSAPTRTEQEPLIVTMEKQKQATIDKIKLSDRTEQREKELTERGYVKDMKVKGWRYYQTFGFITFLAVNSYDDDNWNALMGKHKPEPQPAPYTAGQEVDATFMQIHKEWKPGKYDHYYNGLHYVLVDGYEFPAAFKDDCIRPRPVQVQPEMPEWEKYWREQFWRLIKAYKFEDSGRQLEIDSAIEKLRPLITPKQVTDEEIRDNWDLQKRMNRETYLEDAIALVRWALQKAEGGEG